MKLAKFRDIVDINNLAELHEHLLSRDRGFYGSFWLWHDSGAELAVMINGDDSYVLFISSDRAAQHSTLDLMTNPNVPRAYIGSEGPSLYSSYSEDAEYPDEEVDFLADNYEPTPMSKRYTVPHSQALIVMEEFFISGERSTNIRWYELSAARLPQPPPKPWWQFWK